MSALKAGVTTLAFILMLSGGVGAGVALFAVGQTFPAVVAVLALGSLAVRVMFVGLAWAYPR